MSKLTELREPVRRNMIKNDLRALDIIAVGHNLLGAYDSKNWQRVAKKMESFRYSLNALVEDRNKLETPVEDKIIKLEEEIENLESS